MRIASSLGMRATQFDLSAPNVSNSFSNYMDDNENEDGIERKLRQQLVQFCVSSNEFGTGLCENLPHQSKKDICQLK